MATSTASVGIDFAVVTVDLSGMGCDIHILEKL